MKVKKIINIIENIFPKEFSETFDNVGLLVGSYNNNIKKILITIDVTNEVIEEAIENKCKLIITYHPIIFIKLTNIIKEKYIGYLLIKLIKNNISVYSIHTNLDNVWGGSNSQICDILQIKKKRVLIPKSGTMYKLTTYIPKQYARKLKNSLFKVGAGVLGNYEKCSYTFKGVGSFQGNDQSSPFIGKKNILSHQKEQCINLIFSKHRIYEIKKTLLKNHPYEEVPYEISKLDKNENMKLGAGIVASIKHPILDIDFIRFIKKTLNIKYIKHSKLLNKKVQKIGIIIGSGSFGINYAKQQKLDVFISSDIKYHDFFKAEDKIIIIDIGHYESEFFIKKLLFDVLNKKKYKFTVITSKINTNPIFYNINHD